MKKTLQIILLIFMYCAIALVLPGCKTKHKVVESNKTDVKKETVIKTESEENVTDKSVTNKTEAATKEAEYTEETVLNADSVKVDAKGNTTFYTGGKPVTTKKKASSKQDIKSTEQTVSDIESNKTAGATISAKVDSTGKAKTTTKKASNEKTGKVWAIALVIGIVVLLLILFIFKRFTKLL